MKKLMNFIMLSCKKASGLIVKRESFDLSPVEKMRLYFHLMMCDACSAFSKQSEMIQQVMEKEYNNPEGAPATKDIPENLKEKILSNLR
jgi:hypothetical protein